MTETTWWNGEPCEAKRVRVIVGNPPRRTWWCASQEGTERDAVEVTYYGATFFIDDDRWIEGPKSAREPGSGWRKVTEERGNPNSYHRSLPDGSVVVSERD